MGRVFNHGLYLCGLLLVQLVSNHQLDLHKAVSVHNPVNDRVQSLLIHRLGHVQKLGLHLGEELSLKRKMGSKLSVINIDFSLEKLFT